MRQRYGRRNNTYRFAGERENMWTRSDIMQGDLFNNNKLHEQHHPNNNRRTTARSSIDRSIVTGINIVPPIHHTNLLIESKGRMNIS